MRLRTAVLMLSLVHPVSAQETDFEVIGLGDRAFVLHKAESVNGILVGNSIVVPTGSGSVLIDSGIEPLAEQLVQTIHSLSAPPVRWIGSTHPHLDHIGGHGSFKADSLPSGRRAEVGGVTVQTLRFNAHSDSDVVRYFVEPNILAIGDLYPAGYPALKRQAGSLAAFVEALDSVLDVVDHQTLVIPGHGRPQTAADLRSFRDAVRTMVEEIREFQIQGLTEDDVVSRRSSRAFDQRWGGGFLSPEAWVRQLYRLLEPSLTRSQGSGSKR